MGVSVLWADGIYSGLRAEDTKLCALVIIGVNERGQKRFLTIEDRMRESTQSWREVLLDLKARGFVERLNGKFRNECLNRNWFRSLEEVLRENADGKRIWTEKFVN